MPVDSRVRDFERVIIGIDPGTNVMGYGIVGVNGKKRHDCHGSGEAQ